MFSFHSWKSLSAVNFDFCFWFAILNFPANPSAIVFFPPFGLFWFPCRGNHGTLCRESGRICPFDRDDLASRHRCCICQFGKASKIYGSIAKLSQTSLQVEIHDSFHICNLVLSCKPHLAIRHACSGRLWEMSLRFQIHISSCGWMQSVCN